MNATQPVAGDATWERARDPSRLGQTLYQDWDVHVTQRFVLLPGQIFTIADVDEVSVGRAPSAPAGVVAGLLSAIAMTALAVSVMAHAVTVGFVAAAAMVGFGIAATVVWHTRAHELWITHRGHEVFLLRCHDEVRFFKVVRALQRARQTR
jgi:predicted secreted protein